MAVFPNHHHQKSSDCQTNHNSRSSHLPCPRLLFHSNCQTSLTVMKSSRISMVFLLRLYWVVLPAVTSSLTTCHRSGSTCLTVNRRRMTLTDSPKKNCMLYRVYAWSSTKKKKAVSSSVLSLTFEWNHEMGPWINTAISSVILLLDIHVLVVLVFTLHLSPLSHTHTQCWNSPPCQAHEALPEACKWQETVPGRWVIRWRWVPL